MAGSLLMFLAILYIAIRHHAATGIWSFALEDLYRLTFTGPTATLLFVAFALAFAIKVPVFPLHTWLPDAHTEAPTAGSILLAGILLKLGVYGYLRFALPLFPDTALRYAPWLGVLGVVGVVYGAFVAYAQRDMKRLVAYSSVSHLGLVVVGIGAFTTLSLQGSILQMVNHGLSTGALFLLVGVLYERRHTREIAAYGGLAGIMPVTTALFVIATLSSIGLPGLNGFVGEFLILLGTWASPAPLVGGRGGERRCPLGDLHAHARAEGVLESGPARGEPGASRHPPERAHRGGRPRGPDDLARRAPE